MTSGYRTGQSINPSDPADRATISESNARFWAQTGHKPGQKLDPKNPADRKMMPVWMDIFRKVQAEAAAGKFIPTYDKPSVVQNLSDAQVADAVATVHIDAAAKATDLEIEQQQIAAAAVAAAVATQKKREAAAEQPPTVSPELADRATRTPPQAKASAADHVAHAQAKKAKPPLPPRDLLTKETNERFWQKTNHKRGQKLDMKDPKDRKMSKIWMDLFREVEREAQTGRLRLTMPLPPPPQYPSAPAPPTYQPSPYQPPPYQSRPTPWPAPRPVLGPGPRPFPRPTGPRPPPPLWQSPTGQPSQQQQQQTPPPPPPPSPPSQQPAGDTDTSYSMDDMTPDTKATATPDKSASDTKAPPKISTGAIVGFGAAGVALITLITLAARGSRSRSRGSRTPKVILAAPSRGF